MCLGDLRFSPHVRAVPRLLVVNAAWQVILAPQKERVGLWVGIPSQGRVAVWPGNEPPAGVQGLVVDSAGTGTVLVTYLDHGALAGERWQASATLAGTVLPVIEFLATPALVEEIMRMGLR